MFRKKLTVAGRLAFGFGVLLLLMIFVVLIGITRLQSVDEVAETLIDKDRVIADAISHVDILMRSNGLATLELVINNDAARAGQIRSQVALNKEKITSALATLGALDVKLQEVIRTRSEP
ncbi:MCP four helix bundle domain-containing protein [Herminiimonas contaminans]|uniref:MCP four helix bundle domain-containing protein n=1 Tax=Herminiimonas contaminans TaxID=1111140 RepID=A0ABS0EWA2_9BURK|nr:MCP four helix bundle domain-containing protein [Herminiimonas contaminans]MBF8179115.1 MCP four helix bundle domain-containing protein [Herminiimonas contaminans]